MPAQQVDPFIPWLMRETGARTFYLPSADYIWPRVLNRRVQEIVTANGGAIVGEEYFPLDHTDYEATVERINSSGADVVFNTIVPPGAAPFFEQLADGGVEINLEVQRLAVVPRAVVCPTPFGCDRGAKCSNVSRMCIRSSGCTDNAKLRVCTPDYSGASRGYAYSLA